MKKILIVDDNEQNVYMLQVLLQGHGYQVMTANNGKAALESAQGTPPDLIISDILMPGMDGFALCREWKRTEGIKHSPFIFYTATYTDPKDKEFALSLGAEGFLVKPMEPEIFMEEVEAVLADHEAGRTKPKDELLLNAEEDILRTYNQRLIKKLEDKMEQLEASNQQLRNEIVERKRAEVQAQQQLSRLRALRKIDIAITSSFNLEIIFNIFLDQVISQLGVDAAAIATLDKFSGHLEYRVERGFLNQSMKNTQQVLGEGLVGEIASGGHLIQIDDLAQSELSPQESQIFRAENFVTYFGAPAISKQEVRGVLEVFHRTPFQPDRQWIDYFETLIGQLAIAIDSVAMFHNLQKSNTELGLAYESTLEGWAKALELRDGETEGHSRRVTEMAITLAKALGLSDEEITHLRRGVLLHDIGKMAVPDRILLKAGPLTEEEWQIMRQHPAYAYEMLSPISYLQPSLEIPYCHHEKWDGTGYPRGLKGEQIPLTARIFAIIDHWDAILSDRPYRKAWPREKAIKYIREQSGKFFDPTIVAKFLEIFT